jgi:hypothetical protein
MSVRAVDRLRSWHAAWAAAPEPTPSSVPRRCAWRETGFLVGVNLPWVNYGGDVGANAWRPQGGVGAPSSRAALREHLARIAATGARAVRWFLLCDGRAGILRDADGRLAGLDDCAGRDVDAALDELARAKLRAILVLLDFHWFAPARRHAGVTLGGWRRAGLDIGERRRLIDTVLGPVAARAGGDAPILAWDLLNEPEWATRGFGGTRRGGAVSRRAMRRFLGEAAAAVRDASPHPITVGLASAGGLSLVRDLALDVYQVHWYDAVDARAPLAMPVTQWGLDRPVLLGEFPTRGSALAPEAIVAAARRSGYAGAFAWSALSHDEATGPLRPFGA